MARLYRVDGMSCEGCVRSIKHAIERDVPGAAIIVDLTLGTLTVSGSDDDHGVEAAVTRAGFTYRGPVEAL